MLLVLCSPVTEGKSACLLLSLLGCFQIVFSWELYGADWWSSSLYRPVDLEAAHHRQLLPLSTAFPVWTLNWFQVLSPSNWKCLRHHLSQIPHSIALLEWVLESVREPGSHLIALREVMKQAELRGYKLMWSFIALFEAKRNNQAAFNKWMALLTCTLTCLFVNSVGDTWGIGDSKCCELEGSGIKPRSPPWDGGLLWQQLLLSYSDSGCFCPTVTEANFFLPLDSSMYKIPTRLWLRGLAFHPNHLCFS